MRIILKCPKCTRGWEIDFPQPRVECPSCKHGFTLNLQTAPTLLSFNPKVSLDPRARYTTQSAAYDRLLVGRPLSDRRIAYYQRLRAAEQLGVPPSQVTHILKRKEKAKRMEDLMREYK